MKYSLHQFYYPCLLTDSLDQLAHCVKIKPADLSDFFSQYVINQTKLSYEMLKQFSILDLEDFYWDSNYFMIDPVVSPYVLRLKALGIMLVPETRFLYIQMAKAYQQCEEMVRGIELFAEAGFKPDVNNVIYFCMVMNPSAAANYLKVWQVLVQCRFDVNKLDEAIIQIISYDPHDALLLVDTIEKLNHHDIPYVPAHFWLYDVFFKCIGEHRLSDARQIMSRLIALKSLGNLSENEQLKLYQIACDLTLTDAAFTRIRRRMMKEQCETLTHGPLVKNRSTYLLEQILIGIAQHGLGRVVTHENRWGEYELQYPCDATHVKLVNLTLLCQSADFNHIILTEHCIKHLGGLLEVQYELAGIPRIHLLKLNNPAFSGDVGLILRKAIYSYTMSQAETPHLSSPLYAEVNALLRGRPLINGKSGPCRYNSVLVSLILISLIAHALNQWPQYLSTQDLERSRQQQEEMPLIRKIGDLGFMRQLDLLRSRKMITRLDALTSTSQENAIHQIEHFDKMKFTLFFNNAPLMPALLDAVEITEHEQILLPGLQVIYHSGEAAETLEACVVSTPCRSDNYWIRHALRYCYVNHLSHFYTDIDDRLLLDGRIVARPNHGLAHAFRVCHLIDPVIQYLRCFAQESELSHFCRQLSESDWMLLKIAAIFSVSGRESEVSFQDDLAKYEHYRRRSSTLFLEYVKTFPECIAKSLQVGRVPLLAGFAEVIRFMSNPFYSTTLNTAQGPDRQIRNALNWILSLAHKLDLARCYSASEYQKAIEFYHHGPFIQESPEQAAAFQSLERYVQTLILAHGDRLMCQTEGDQLIDSTLSYQPMFADYSSNPALLEREASFIPRPNIEPSILDHASTPNKIW